MLSPEKTATLRISNQKRRLPDLTAVDLWDKFTLTLASQKTIQKDYSLEDKNDLICKAINLLEQITKKSFTYHLKIEKFIPMGAGLG